MFIRKLKNKILPLSVLALILSGCGSSVDSSDTSDSSNLVISGKVTDGPVQNSLVWFDLNNNLIFDNNEPFAMSNNLGRFEIRPTENIPTGAILRAKDGVDTSTNLPFTGMMEAIPETVTGNITQMVTPLTTLKANGVSENTIRQLFPDLPTGNVNQLDPESDDAVYKAGVVLHTTIAQIHNATPQSDNTAFHQIYKELANEAITNPQKLEKLNFPAIIQRAINIESDKAITITSVLIGAVKNMSNLGNDQKQQLHNLQISALDGLQNYMSSFVSGNTTAGILLYEAGRFFPQIEQNLPESPSTDEQTPVTEQEPITENETSQNLPYRLVATEVKLCYDSFNEISCPEAGQRFYGQDAQYSKNQASYTNNGDGTITDNITGLMWQKSMSYMEWKDAAANAAADRTGGHSDWRVPTIKELYSLIDFNGNQGSGNPESNIVPTDAIPFINTSYFDFEYPASGRYINVQFLSQTSYTSNAMNNPNVAFGLNLADGRIKAYPKEGREFPARFVRGNPDYGQNDFSDNGDDTITDNATGLMWAKYDSGHSSFQDVVSGYSNTNGALNWEEALHFSENAVFAGYSDWRLPNAKELHSILDYSRSPDHTDSPAINPLFSTSTIVNEAGVSDYPAFWSSTTFKNPVSDAIIIYFGEALGYFNGQFMDVHGAGCQRTDPKSGSASYGHGPQGDVRRVYNYVRLVRDI